MTVATMTSKGQITVPKEVRDELKLEAGTKIDFIRVNDHEYRLSPRNLHVADLFGILKYDGPPVSLDDMTDAAQAGWAGELGS